jgi:hypothetical protein
MEIGCVRCGERSLGSMGFFYLWLKCTVYLPLGYWDCSASRERHHDVDTRPSQRGDTDAPCPRTPRLPSVHARPSIAEAQRSREP